MSFRVTMSKDLGMKRGRLAGSFVHESKQQTLLPVDRAGPSSLDTHGSEAAVGSHG